MRRKLKRRKRLCACGCGECVSLRKPRRKGWNTFIHGHGRKGTKVSKEEIEKRVSGLKKDFELNGSWKKGKARINGKWIDKSEIELPLCQCGCGKLVKRYKSKYIHGHNETSRMTGKIPWNKGLTIEDPRMAQIALKLRTKFPQECECGCKQMTAPGMKFVTGHNRRGVKQTLKTIKRRVKKLRGQKRSEEQRKYMASKSWNKGLTKKTSKIVKKASKKISKTMKENFLDEEFSKRFFSGRNARPNKLELYMDNILKELFPGEYKYVGDFDTFIGGKNPDFININGQKKLIEVFGDYWHRDDDSTIRKSHFANYGFQTLILWECDIRENIDWVKDELVCFHKKRKLKLRSKSC